MRFHILGAGAIGSLLATILADNGQQISIINRARNSRVKVTRRSQDIINTYEFEGFDPATPISCLLICTKAQDVVTALQSFAQYLSPTTQIIDLANGMGHQHQLADIFDSYQILSGTISYGAYWLDHVLIFAGQGDVHIGALDGSRLPPQAQLPQPFTWSENINERLWTKLAINCAINPLTVIYQCSNGLLLHITEAMKQIELICSEVEKVAAIAGVRLSRTRQAALEVIERTAQNQSSTLQDFLNGKNLELDYINGYIVTKAKQIGLDTPANQQVLQKISQLMN